MNGLTPALADNLVPLPARIACLDGVRYLGAASFEEEGVELLGLSCLIPAGFPSPALEYAEERLDIGRRLVRNPATTFFARADGDSMNRAGILSNAILIVERGVDARDGDIVIAEVSGEFTVKRLRRRGGRLRLEPESDDPRYRAIEPGEGEAVTIWGVVKSVVNEF